VVATKPDPSPDVVLVTLQPSTRRRPVARAGGAQQEPGVELGRDNAVVFPPQVQRLDPWRAIIPMIVTTDAQNAPKKIVVQASRILDERARPNNS
jgi:hypothetical protein